MWPGALSVVITLLSLCLNVCSVTAKTGSSTLCPSLQQISSDLTQLSPTVNTDKFNQYHQYQFAYSHLIQCQRHDEMTFLEIGLGCDGSTYTPGASALLWQTIFPKLRLYFIELDRACSERVQPSIQGHIFIGSQDDLEFLSKVTSTIGTGADFIVDDGSHHVMHQIQTLNALYPTLLRPGGTYVVEDLLTSFMTGYGGNALGTGVTALAYMVQLVAGLVGVISLPYHMPDVVEVGCVNALCWVHKGPVGQASWRGGDCPSSANRSANQAAAAGLGELPPSVIRHLRCLEGGEASVLHVTYGSDENQDQNQNRLRSSLPPLLWEAYYPNSQVTRLTVHEGSPDDRFQRVHAAAVDVIVDDGTLPGGLQERAFSLLLQHSLAPGGLYLFQVPPSMGMGGKEALKRLMEKVIYEFYVWHEFRVQPWNEAVHYAGCGRSVCFVRKVLPWVRRASSREYFDHICQLGGGCIFAPQWDRRRTELKAEVRSEVIRVNPPVPLEALPPEVVMNFPSTGRVASWKRLSRRRPLVSRNDDADLVVWASGGVSFLLTNFLVYYLRRGGRGGNLPAHTVATLLLGLALLVYVHFLR